MKALSRGGVIQKQKLCRPVSDHGDRYGVPVTPCTSGREPDQTGEKMTYIGFLSYFHNDTYVIYQSSTVYTLHIFSALNATVAVQRVRTRQSQPEEAKEEQSVLVAQVLNPDVPFNQSGNFW